MKSELSVYLVTLKEWNEQLRERVLFYDKTKKELKEYSEIWHITKKNVDKNKVPKEIKKYLKSIIKELSELSTEVSQSYNKLLVNLTKVETQISIIKDKLEFLKKHEVIVSSKIFYQDKLPYHQLFLRDDFDIFGMLNSIKYSIVDKLADSYEFFNVNYIDTRIVIIIDTILAFLILYFFYLYKNNKLFVYEASLEKKRFKFINYPISTYLMLVSLTISMIFADKPKALLDITILLLMIPSYKILSTIVEENQHKYLSIFISFYTVCMLSNNIIAYELDNRTISLILEILFLINIYYFLKSKILEGIESSLLSNIIVNLLYLIAFFISISIFSNLYGAVILSSRISDSIYLAIYASLLFYAVYIVLTGYIVILLRRRVSTASYMLEKYSKRLETTAMSFVKIIMIFWWVKILLKAIGLYPYAVEFFKYILSLSWSFASITISVESIFNFIIIIVATWALSKIVKTILEVEVFARFKFPRGIPTAITTTLNYVILILGTFIAFSSLGMSSEQFTLIFGALGVGIGFGIRNIIANFISGIIMVFERPIQIGDTIEITNTMGDVQSIGARSSTIKTFDGSEVIIPNADFISKEIINWTLSDNRRRKVIVFKLDFNTDIELVLSIMEEVASGHVDVLKDPPPQAAFLGFGEYYLEFKLYFWLSDNIIAAQSELAIGIYKALQNAGIKMPLPKSEYIKID
jgi:small-conductance mechanosensitive channel